MILDVLPINMKNLEAPNYTRPLEVFWMKVPEELLSWDDDKVENWRQSNKKLLNS